MRPRVDEGPIERQPWLTELPFLIVISLVCALKMMLIWGNEMVPEGSDSTGYLFYASRWFYGWDELPLRGPVFPLFIAFFHALHLPFRLGSEAVFISAAAAFSGSLPRVAVPRTLCVLILAGLVFHPGSFYTFDMPMSEGLFAIITLLLLTGVVWALTGRSRTGRMLASASVGLSASLLVNERGNDTVLVYGMVAYAAVSVISSGLIDRARSPMLAPRALAALGSAAVMLMVFVAGNIVDSAANYLVWGYFGPNELLTKGQQRLIGDLVAIDTGERPLHKWIPITNRTLQIAYGLSPTLSGYREEIEGPFRRSIDGSAYAGRSRTGIAGQFDISDIFGLVGTVLKPSKDQAGDNWIVKMQKTDRLDSVIADEIEQGFSQGRAKRKITLYIWNLTSPLLLDAVRDSATHIIASLFDFRSPQLIDNFPFYGSLYSPLYDTMLDRRLELVSKGPLEGFIAVDGSVPVRKVDFLNNTVGFFARQGSNDAILRDIGNLHGAGFQDYADLGGSTVTPVSSAQAPATLASTASHDDSFYRFSIGPVRDRFFLYFGKLIVTDAQGRTAACEDLGVGQAIQAGFGQGGPTVKCLVTAFDLHLQGWQRWGYAVQGVILAGFNAFSKSASALLVACAVIIAIARRLRAGSGPQRRRLNLDQLLLSGLLVFIIVERVVFFSFIDATIFPINDDRHLFDSNIFLVPTVCMACWLIVGGLGRIEWKK